MNKGRILKHSTTMTHVSHSQALWGIGVLPNTYTHSAWANWFSGTFKHFSQADVKKSQWQINPGSHGCLRSNQHPPTYTPAHIDIKHVYKFVKQYVKKHLQIMRFWVRWWHCSAKNTEPHIRFCLNVKTIWLNSG